MSQWKQEKDDEQAVRSVLGRLLFSQDFRQSWLRSIHIFYVDSGMCGVYVPNRKVASQFFPFTILGTTSFPMCNHVAAL